MISSWFVQDLLLSRKDAKANHIVQAVGSSSPEKGSIFAQKLSINPTIHSYQDLYQDPAVDIIYIGTPHAFHKRNCLDAIAAGKHVLCEKAFTITEKEAKEVLDAARAKGVFIMEAMWTRFMPLVAYLKEKLPMIGEVKRVFCDFGLDMDIKSLGPESRLKNPMLGAGSLLDIGIYSLTWGLLMVDFDRIAAVQTIEDGIDVASTIILQGKGVQAILTSSLSCKSDSKFCRIEGTNGHIVVEGPAASAPKSFTIFIKGTEPEAYKYEHEGFGFYYEADAVALDIAAGKKENNVMPHSETLRMMRLMDEIRMQGGATFPQDDD